MPSLLEFLDDVAPEFDRALRGPGFELGVLRVRRADATEAASPPAPSPRPRPALEDGRDENNRVIQQTAPEEILIGFPRRESKVAPVALAPLPAPVQAPTTTSISERNRAENVRVISVSQNEPTERERAAAVKVQQSVPLPRILGVIREAPGGVATLIELVAWFQVDRAGLALALKEHVAAGDLIERDHGFAAAYAKKSVQGPKV